MTGLLHFALGFGLSLLGTIPLGIITLSIVQTAIFRGFRAAYTFSSGAVVVEFFYTVIALKFIDLFLAHPTIDKTINWIALGTFFGLSLYYFMLPAKTSIKESRPKGQNSDFYRGIGISSLNMLIIPYWIFLGTWLNAENWISLSNFYIFIFSMGAALGALTVFLAYAHLSQFLLTKIGRITKYTNMAIGMVFLILTGYQIIKMLW